MTVVQRAPTPVGGWDVMASNGNPPQFPSAFTAWKYFDWVEPIEATESGTYTLSPLSEQENVLYKNTISGIVKRNILLLNIESR